MPELGPNGRYMYLPHEAYNAMGRHLFRNDWARNLLRRPASASTGGTRAFSTVMTPTEDQRRVIGDPTSEHYENGSAKVGHGSGVIISLRAA